MITTKMTDRMLQQFNTKALQEIGLAAQGFVNTLDDINDAPWQADQAARDALMALQMLRDACQLVIKLKEGLE